MSFGSRLKELRREIGYSQKDVGTRLGVSATTICQYESGSRFPNEDILKKLCLFYAISSDYLLGLTDIKGPKAEQEETIIKQIDALREIVEKFYFCERRKNNIPYLTIIEKEDNR